MEDEDAGCRWATEMVAEWAVRTEMGGSLIQERDLRTSSEGKIRDPLVH